MTAPEAAGGPILAVLKEKDREEILRDARRRTFAPGEVVVREGDSSLNLFIVLSGHARLQHAEGAMPDMGPGTFFGELGIIEQHPRTATVVAVDELTCLLLPAWEFRSLLDEHPEMAVPMLRVLIARLHGLSPHEH
jgi:CRP-like cAMP-binding protein